MLLVELGLRAIRHQDARRRAALLLVGACLAVTAALTAVAALRVVGRERSRAARLVVADTAAARLLSFRAVPHDYRGQTITIVEVAPRAPDAPRPAGLKRLPAKAEAFLSPALADRVATDRTLRRWLPYPAAVLPREAVGSAGQLLAYVGSDPSSFDDGDVPERQLLDSAFARDGGRAGRYPALGFALFCVGSALVFVVVCARLGSRVQRQRTLALRLVGVSRRGAALVASIETLPWAALGGVLGWLTFHVASRQINPLPIVNRRFFAEDAALSAPTVLIVIVTMTALIATLSGLVALSAGRIVKVSRPALGHRLASRWTMALLAAGAAFLAWAYVRRRSGDPVLTAAIVLYGLGLPSATVLVSQAVAARWARRAVPTSVLLGLRRIEHDPGRALRVAGVAAVAVYAVSVAQPVTQVLDAASGDWVEAARRARPEGLVGGIDSLTTEPLRLAERTPSSLLMMLPIVDMTERPRSPVALVASCRQLEEVAARPLVGCVDEPRRLRVVASTGPTPSGTLDLPMGSIPAVADWIVPPTTAQADGILRHPLRGGVVKVKPTLAAWQEVQAWIVAENPAYRLNNFFQANLRTSTVGLWLLLGAAVASTLILLSGAVLAYETAFLRRHELFALWAVGVPRRRLRRAQLTEAVLAGGVSIGLALAGALGVTAAYGHALRDEPWPSLTPYVLAALGGLGMIVGIAWTSSLAIPSRPVDRPDRGAR